MIQPNLKGVARRLGVEVFKWKTLPFGINHYRDMKRLVGEDYQPGIVFDVGANIGQTSSKIRNYFNKSKIYAFEPVGSTYRQLIENVADSTINTFNLGFGDKEKRSRIFLQHSSGLNSLVEDINKPLDNGATFEEVDITTIDLFCEKHSIVTIDLLKIDTEGFGMKVLSGARKMLSNSRISWVYIEVGFKNDDKRHDSFYEVSNYLGQYGFVLTGFYDQWIKDFRQEYCNALFYRPT